MATVLDVQHERAYQKQEGASFFNSKKIKKGSKTHTRYWKNVGMGFAVPKEAKEGVYVDKKCPFTGNVSIRGRILKGMVISNKMKRTIIIRRNYLHYVKKYNRFEKRHKNIPCHCSPCFDVKEGDIVTVGQCRPLSKTVRFNVLHVEKHQIFGSARKQFVLF
ncbi:40S ribosomal protein S11, putative [Plasmodium chabaudi chabaudi]|nr:40S ribosomal protein S11, putative [Plasmodium chabaudi chabaudi]SCM20830.1 40S ribosomal protein S11, putative [Plasmodium chabaudi chabaudi]SCN59419.1 40S ribosomal protein S11, putative [Plasmodium chabaudi chabaudi]VTZ68285.1 40S ribosomal protein S11, putative [Plasmodium chabaudi chabaudi]|eukprot:XP_739413.1 40S ribosomal protein S11, putative [Plasmodium chabaudi chabaudi]